jgi:hypothetical protein
MEQARGRGGVGYSKVQLAEITVVDQGPVIVAGADHAHEAVCGVLEQVADDPARPAIDDAGPDDGGP